MRIDPCPYSVGWGSDITMSCGVGPCGCGSDLTLSLGTYMCRGYRPKKQKKKKKERKKSFL